MSWKVTEEFIQISRSRLAARNVGLIISETAHHDGVGWLRLGESKSRRRRPAGKPDTNNIAFRTKLSVRHSRRCIDVLQGLDELEVVWARDGQRRFHVYRVIVGHLRELEVDYDRGLPELEGRFWTSHELLLPVAKRPLDGHVPPPSLVSNKPDERGDILAPCKDVDPTEDGRTSESERGDICDANGGTSASGHSVIGARATSLDHVPNLVQGSEWRIPLQTRGDTDGPERSGLGDHSTSERSEFETPPRALKQLAAVNHTPLIPEAGPRSVSIQPLLDLLPPHRIQKNTREELQDIFSRLPSNFVRQARQEFLESPEISAGNVRKPAGYLIKIGRRMLEERVTAA